MNKVVQPERLRARGLIAAFAAATIAASGLLTAQPAVAAPPALEPSSGLAVSAVAEDESEFSLLVFSKTAGFRHGSIPAGIAAIQSLGEEHGFDVDTTEDSSLFTDANLAQYDAVVWLSTTGDVLNGDQEAAFERYIQNGGGYAGIHAASDTEYDWPWYGELVGGYFNGHPQNQNATVVVEDHAHASTSHLDDEWVRFDEWYNFRNLSRDNVHVLMSLDEKSYQGGTMGADHPIAWCSNFDGGRAWYTGGGHTDESFEEPNFLEHLLGGLRTASGVEDADCGASQTSSYELVPLDESTGNPMSLSVTEDGTVFYVERDGRLRRIDPETQQASTALQLAVTLGNEDGFLGFVLDPAFEDNGWAYAYWSPATVGTDGPHNRISRFQYDPVSKTFDASSEIAMLKITTQRNECCHAGGDMIFDLDGNLILATGDNTNPFASDGYTPIDERPGRSSWDAQGTAGNTNDLRGKLVRITPQADGTYTIPEGNLFEEGTDKTRAEIYAMGFRNPFRIGLDPYTGNILVGDYGPDAGSANPNRGPAATTEWNIVDEPGNYGWPYCAGVKCYNDYNFATSQAGAVFNPNALINNSPNNTGLTELPPVINPEWYGESGQTQLFPEIGYTGAPMGGPLYKFDPDLDSDVKWPEYWDNKALFGDWNSGRLFSMQLNRDTTDAARNTQIVDVNRMLPGMLDPSKNFHRTMDAEFGPDGALYVIDWGSGFGGDNASSGIYRIDYVLGNPSPIARAQADVTNGAGDSLTVNFSSDGTRHPAGKQFTIEWDFGDGSETTTEANPTHTYEGIGEYTASLTVIDEDGRDAIATVTVVVGNAVPEVSIVFPEQGGFFNWGDEVAYKVVINDPDAAGEIDCSRVQVLPALGHDSHQHPMGQLSGCEGSIETGRDGGHGITSNIFWVVDVRYTDDGGLAGIPLTGYGTNVLNPKHFEAEFFDRTGNLTDPDGGVQTETTSDAGGGMNLSYVDPGDWWSYEPVNFKGIDGITVRAASPGNGGVVSMRWNAPDGPEIGSIAYPGTGDWQQYVSTTVDLTDLPSETGELYFVSVSGQINVNYFEWVGRGVDSNARPVVELSATPTTGNAPLVVDASVTAEDPEGGEVTYKWRSDDGAELIDGTTTQQFVYDEPGIYQLGVRVTDEQGAYEEKTVSITVTTPGSGMCLTGRSDGFDGVTLDNSRWNRIVRPNQDAHVANGHLVIPASKTDIYGNGGNVPNITLQDLPSGAWQATTKVTFPARSQYQQAGLVVYGDDDNYAKMVMQGRSAQSDAATRIFQFIREEAAAPNEVAESNTANLGADFPDTFFVRFTSDGQNLNASYSADGVDFTSMSETKSLSGIENPRIGLAAFANSGSPADVINAEFDWFHITPDDTAVADGPNDDFDGDMLDACRWDVVYEDTTGYRVADGSLQIDTSSGDIYSGDTGATNFILQAQPEGDEWVVETQVDGSALDRRYQQGGLILYGNDDNYVKLDIVATNEAGSTVARNIELRNEIGGVVQNPQPNADAPQNGKVWLRLAKAGNVYTGWTSSDGTTWTALTEPVTNAGLTGARVGLFALGTTNQGQVSNTVAFDYFRVVDGDEPTEPVTVSASITPAEPNGSNGWYTQAVSIALAAQGGGTGTVYREYNLNGAGWLEYTTPVNVTIDGEHTLQYRASASGETTDVAELSFSIDATAPTASAQLIVDGAERTVAITAADATSGVDVIEYRIGDGEWVVYESPVVIDDTEQSIAYRVVDLAGNTSADQVLEVPAVVDPEAPTISIDVSVDPAEPNGLRGWYTSAVTVSATGASTDEDSDVTVEFSTDGESFATLVEPLVLGEDGAATVWLRAVDGEGHLSPTVQRSVSIDTVVPTVAATVDGRTVTFAADDATSGVDRVEYRLAGDAEGLWRTATETTTVAGRDAETVSYRAVDVAGNASEVASVDVAAVEEPEPQGAVTVDEKSVRQGDLIRVTGTGFAPNATLGIWLYSEPIELGTVVTDANGGFAVTVRVPLNAEVGEHRVIIRDGETIVAESGALTVTAAAVDPGPGDGGGPGNGGPGGSGGGSGLASTGADAWTTLVPLALILLFGGFGVVMLGARRRAGRQQ